MKKTITVFIAVLLLFSVLLTGCGTKENGSTGSDAAFTPVLSVSEAKAGDTVTVEVYADNFKWLTDADFYLSYDAAYVDYVTAVEEEVEDLYTVLTNDADEGGNAFLSMSCYTMYTINLKHEKLFTVTFKVRDDAPAGEAFFGIALSNCNRGTDKEGSATVSMRDSVAEGGASLQIVG